MDKSFYIGFIYDQFFLSYIHWNNHIACTPGTAVSLSHTHAHHHHLAIMELGYLLTHSGLTHLEVSSMVSPCFFCLLVCSFLVFLVIYYRAFCLYVAINFFFIPVFCPKHACPEAKVAILPLDICCSGLTTHSRGIPITGKPLTHIPNHLCISQ